MAETGTDGGQVEFERIRILFSSIKGIVIGVVTMTIFAGVYISTYMPVHLVITWIAFALVSIIPRVMVVNRFNQGIESQTLNAENVQPWENKWIYTAIPIVLVFSSLSFLPFNNIEELLVIAIFLTILGAGSVLTSNTSLKSLTISTLILIVPLIIRLFLEGSLVANILAVFFIATMLIFRIYALRVNRTLMDNIRLKIENESISLTDHLTNLWNRRGLYFYIEKLIPRCLRSNEPFTIIMLDIDNFKDFNDTRGHNAGDVELARVAICIEQETRDGDLVVRYGGEEFIIVLPATSMEQTKEVAERVCKNVRENSEVTISGGLAIFRPEMNIPELIHKADQALYAAKDAGKDQFISAEDTLA